VRKSKSKIYIYKRQKRDLKDSTKWTKAGIVHTWTAFAAAGQHFLQAWTAPAR
jgi:hypothetical protein